jgi:beta-glucuronidase
MEESGMAGRWQRWGGVAILALCMAGQVFAATRVDLDGTGWTFRTTLEENAADVTVPHCWPASERYRRYIGIGTYEHDFDAPAAGTGKVVRLRFDAVYEQASVWLNGRRLGAHQGGYTPFEFDVTKLLKPGKNHLLVEVNNTPTVSTIPAIATSHGSREYPAYGAAAGDGIVGWMPYGGIVRPVSLLITDAVYLRNMKIDTKPDLARHSASITVHAWIHNSGANAAITAVRGTIAGLPVTFPRVKVAGSSDAVITWSGNLKDAHLWSVRDPFLYDASLHVAGDKLDAKIGVREIRVQGTELLLNGQPVHLFGANRVSEDAKEGLRESDAIVERDMSDMLADNMRMMRIAHYPQAPALLDFADKHGMLIIAEAGNWNMGAWQMADPEIRATWQKQMKEMMEQDWNHPSVIAWSVGNEYESFTKDGIDWTRDMRTFTLDTDPTRLITFASRFTGDPSVKTGVDEASQYSDFVSVNIYGNYARAFDHVHALYPDKPVFVTEFGKMGEPGPHDPERIKDITEAVKAMKERPWMIGGSLWAWADYRSLHRGTPASGIRYWGVVNLDREHRDSWQAVHDLFDTEFLEGK